MQRDNSTSSPDCLHDLDGDIEIFIIVSPNLVKVKDMVSQLTNRGFANNWFLSQLCYV